MRETLILPRNIQKIQEAYFAFSMDPNAMQPSTMIPSRAIRPTPQQCIQVEGEGIGVIDITKVGFDLAHMFLILKASVTILSLNIPIIKTEDLMQYISLLFFHPKDLSPS